MTDRIEDGGPAYPVVIAKKFDGRTGVAIEQDFYRGMTLRDYFAGQALAGMATSAGFQGAPWDKLAADAYEAANAMLTARQMGLQTGGRTHG
jgi:hypothetical protein